MFEQKVNLGGYDCGDDPSEDEEQAGEASSISSIDINEIIKEQEEETKETTIINKTTESYIPKTP